MEIVNNLSELPNSLGYAVSAIGVFDGVHLGHRTILRTLVERAREKSGSSVLLTFSPHPQKVISPGDAPLLLQTEEQKREMLARQGIDILVELPFTRKLSLLSPEDFARQILYSHGIREIHVGSNFRFGHRRSGDLQTLRELGLQYEFEVCETSPVCFRNLRISSTKIRKVLAAGDVSLAGRLLGRPYQIRGTVVRGSSRGAGLGFPTANLHPDNELAPARGVYVTRFLIQGEPELSVTNVGYRPTVSRAPRETPIVETHVLGFQGDLYGQRVALEFCFRLRPEARFSGVEELRRQIEKDVGRAQTYQRRYNRWNQEGTCP